MTLLKRNRLKWVGTTAFLILVSGCSNITVNESSNDVIKSTKHNLVGKGKQQWSGIQESLLTQGEVANGNWWKELKDPNLNQIIDKAVGNNYQIW